jgi:hypothetical protein
VWFLSAAHDDRALDRILSALPAAARAAAAVAGPERGTAAVPGPERGEGD